MFGIQYYPTPKAIVKKMIAPYLKTYTNTDPDYGYKTKHTFLKHDFTILEPSAGTGHILDVLKESLGKDKLVAYCCEIDPTFQLTLREKGYRLIGADFLQYSGTDYTFDLILMNPPFQNGDEHLLKAWHLLYSGDICCLLNSETINNPHTAQRKLLANIIKEHGTVEHLGAVFANSENPTDVEVSLVRLKKTANAGRFEFNFKNVGTEKQPELTENTFKDALATRDVIGNMELQYNELKKHFVGFMQAYDALNFYDNGLIPQNAPEGFSSAATIAINALRKNRNNAGAMNQFCDNMKQNIWRQVLTQANVEKYMTHKVRQNFQQFIEQQGHMDFTKEAVIDLINFLFENSNTILDEAIIAVFDKFTAYYKENRLHVEGWKTNDKFKVNRKIILPNWVTWGSYMNSHDLRQYGDNFSVNTSYSSEYSDIDKVMCYLTGSDYTKINTIYNALHDKFKALGKVGSGSFDGTCESEFFTMRFFKKGTLHLEFKDKKLWERFNLAACAGKNWLPEQEFKAYRAQQQKPERLKLVA